MAIFHLDVSVISRGNGQSAVASAAYRGGEKLFDERQGLNFDYSNKDGIAYSSILAPANSPDWVTHRERLWNEVEKSEVRKNSRLAREIKIALPKELNLEKNIELINEFCQNQYVDKGMVADINIHMDNKENPHAHIMLTTREISPQGFGIKNREWNKRELVFEQRREWMELANNYLHQEGHITRIDCRSLKDRGLELLPGIHLGSSAHHASERGEGDEFKIYRELTEIKRINGDNLINDPSPALLKITQQQAVFTDYDIAKIADQYSVELEQYKKVIESIKNSPEIVHLGEDQFDNQAFTTKAMIELEHKMLGHAYELNQKNICRVGGVVEQRTLNEKSLNQEQQQAFKHLISDGELKLMSGLAGTGKSYLLGAVREAFESTGNKVHGVSFSGLAAKGLQDSSGIISTTVDSKLLSWQNGNDLLDKNCILVIDEAAMLGTDKLEKLLSHANDANAKVILAYDTEQLGAIEAGAPARALAGRFGDVKLKGVVRQEQEWMRQATIEFGTRQTKKALDRYFEAGAIDLTAPDESVARQMVINAWNADRLKCESQIILAYTNKNVHALNEMAREIRINNKELGDGWVFDTSRGKKDFRENERVYFLRNNKEMGIKNGSLGTIKQISKDKNTLSIILDGKDDQIINVNLKKYNSIDYGYAATIHKTQGVTADRGYLLADRYFDRILSYVACSRHRKFLKIFGDQKNFKNYDMLVDYLSRDRSKGMAVDYAEARWIEPSSKRECNLSKGSDENDKAKQNLIIKELKQHLPDKDFSFLKAFEVFTCTVNGIIESSFGKKIACFIRNGKFKLTDFSESLAKKVGKEVQIKTDSFGNVKNVNNIAQNKEIAKVKTKVQEKDSGMGIY